MSDEPLNLGFEEAGALFESASQNARVWTEQWAHLRLFCPNCGAAPVSRYPNNQPVADFFCAACAEDYELKSSKRPFGRRVTDGAYAAMCARIASPNNPNLVLMNYDVKTLGVTDLFFVPKQFLTREIIQPRPPLKPTARRAGWVGCNILIGDIPEAGKIHFIRGRQTAPRAQVLAQWRSTLFLRDQAAAARGWLIEVMKCVDLIGRPAFTLDDVYAFEPRLAALYPGNHNVRPKIRQQLQVLRDAGWLAFEGRGRYRVRALNQPAGN
ncbi:MAG TPA: DpnI domain-containing protein [Caulobacteraceae bacterium]